MKPVSIVHPITGQRCFTKHPEKLLARFRAQRNGGVLIGVHPANKSYAIVIVDGWSFPHTQWLSGSTDAS